MANSGKNTNGSQFFITFQPADYLDNKHAVFGEVVGGLKLLDDIEKVGADEKERPKKEVKIISAEVFSNPFRDVISELLLKHTSEKYKSGKKNSEIEFEKRVENSFKNISGSNEDLIGKYLNKKRNLSQFIGIQQQDPYLYEKPSGTRKQGEFDFTDW
jgi:peptidyl-prolyl cis-trans isomerase-like protein 2